MPELPEVETVRRGLDARVVGRRIERVEVGRERTVRRTSRQHLIDGLLGATVSVAGRHGKYLVCSLDTGDALMIHLRMSGQLLLAPAGAARPAHTHVVLGLGDTDELWFVDPRTFGEMVVFDPDHAADQVPELARLGIDAVSSELDRAHLAGLMRRHRQLKPLLLDQHVIAGLGNIYTDEVLHRSRLHPFRSADGITARDVGRLHEAITTVLGEAIAAGGSTLADAQYVDLMGGGGSYQDDHRVYGRTGLPCPTCGRGVIRRLTLGGRSTHLCAVCQPYR